MKPIEKLSISPTPWRVNIDLEYGDIEVNDRNDHTIAHVFSWMPTTDANLIAAAPKMYETLRDAVNDVCHDCRYAEDGKCTNEDRECHVQRWREVLAEAAGEVSNG